METDNYVVICSGVNRSTRAQADVMIWIHNSIRNTIIKKHTWAKNSFITTEWWKREIIIFRLNVPEEGRVKENDKFYDELQEMLNKINKNDKMLLSRDLNACIGNDEFHNIARRFREQVINTSGLKIRDFATNNNMKIINSFYKQKIYVHIYGHLAISKQLQTISLLTGEYRNYS